MKYNVWALVALVFTLGLAACSTQSDKPGSAVAAPLTEQERTVAEVTKEVADIKNYRGVTPVGWAAELKPGSGRTTDEVSTTLSKLSSLDTRLENLPHTDKVGSLRSDIRDLMIEDCKLLLRKAKSEQNIWALGQFVHYAQNLDVSLETDFNVKTGDLRKEALVMAKKELVELRPRIKEGSGDAIGGLMILQSEWEFTPIELGLTVDEAKLLVRR